MNSPAAILQQDPAVEFRQVLEAAGLLADDVVPDGILRRCGTSDHPESKNGAFRLFADGRGGWFENHADGRGVQFWTASGREPLTMAERAAYRKEVEQLKAERKKAEAENRATAITAARGFLDGLEPAGDANPYLTRKGVKAVPGLLTDGADLVCPVLGADGKGMSYQRINADGTKRFAPGAAVAGGFFSIGPKKGDSPLCIAEGLATALSVFEATGGPVLTAFSSGNLLAVSMMARQRYPERRIIVCGDNDSETETRTGKNPGIDAAKAAAVAVNGWLAIPEGGGDFNDLHQAQGLEAVKRIVDAAGPNVRNCAQNESIPLAEESTTTTAADDWPEPMELTHCEENESYPTEALPGLLGEVVKEVAGFVQCPLPLAACSCLAAVSAVVGGLVDVRRAEGLTGPSTLYFMVLADSGERKTTADSAFTTGIRAWQTRQAEIGKPDLQEWRAADAAWTAEREGIINAIRDAAKRGKDNAELKTRLADLEAKKPERPRVPRLLWDDATTEALTWGLANRWPVGGILSSEGGAVLGGHSMRPESIMKNLAVLNGLWDGTTTSIDRKTSDSYTIEAARLTLGLALQPEVMRQFIAGTHGLARGSGFLARFLLAWPESTQGRRMFKEAPESWPCLGRFHHRLAELLEDPLPMDETGVLRPVILGLDAAAKDLWINLHDTVEGELLPGGDMSEARDIASKAADNAARLAALFRVFECGPGGMIGADHMEAASRIIVWHLYEARRFLGQMATPEAVADAMALEGWLLEYCRREGLKAVPIADIQQKGPNRTRRKAALESALSELEQCDRTMKAKDGRKVFIRINPSILEGC